jgi:hypothetical protein
LNSAARGRPGGRKRGVDGRLTVGPTSRKKITKIDKIESYYSILLY